MLFKERIICSEMLRIKSPHVIHTLYYYN